MVPSLVFVTATECSEPDPPMPPMQSIKPPYLPCPSEMAHPMSKDSLAPNVFALSSAQPTPIANPMHAEPGSG